MWRIVLLASVVLMGACDRNPTEPIPCSPATATVVDTLRNANGQLVAIVSYCGGARPAR